MQALTSEEGDIIPSLAPAFERYNEAQLTTVKLPGSSQEVGISALQPAAAKFTDIAGGYRQ